MSSLKSVSKENAKKIQEICKSFGYDFKLGHAYELLSKLEGHDSWNVLSAKEKKGVIIKIPYLFPEIGPLGNGVLSYYVKIKSVAEVKLDLEVKAYSPEEALSSARNFLSRDIDTSYWKPIYIENERNRVTEVSSQDGSGFSFEDEFQEESGMLTNLYSDEEFYSPKNERVGITLNDIGLIGNASKNRERIRKIEEKVLQELNS